MKANPFPGREKHGPFFTWTKRQSTTSHAVCTRLEVEDNMDLLTWAIVAFVISLIAGALGFTGVAKGAATIAKILFGIFLVIALIIIALIVLGVGAVA